MNKFTPSIISIMNTYAAGPGLVSALEAYIATIEKQARVYAEDNMAKMVCEHLHDGEPNGIKCMSCYVAETTARDTLMVQSEIDISHQREHS